MKPSTHEQKRTAAENRIGMVIRKTVEGGELNHCPAEPGYTLPLQTVQIQISWLQKPTDLDLHCLPLSM